MKREFASFPCADVKYSPPPLSPAGGQRSSPPSLIHFLFSIADRLGARPPPLNSNKKRYYFFILFSEESQGGFLTFLFNRSEGFSLPLVGLDIDSVLFSSFFLVVLLFQVWRAWIIFSVKASFPSSMVFALPPASPFSSPVLSQRCRLSPPCCVEPIRHSFPIFPVRMENSSREHSVSLLIVRGVLFSCSTMFFFPRDLLLHQALASFSLGGLHAKGTLFAFPAFSAGFPHSTVPGFLPFLSPFPLLLRVTFFFFPPLHNKQRNALSPLFHPFLDIYFSSLFPRAEAS